MDSAEYRLEIDRSIASHIRIIENRFFEFNNLSHSPNGIGSTPKRRNGKRGPEVPDQDLPYESDVTINGVGGLNEQISFLQRSVIYPLIHKNSLSKFGFVPPKGIIFHGSPGTGKTLMAKAIASELSKSMQKQVSFIYRKGTDCFSPMVGESNNNLRMIFHVAEVTKPCLLFFDEIDGLCPSRAATNCEHSNGVVTTFLGLMDAIVPGEVIVIGSTNRLESVDPALRRPGRFDKELMFYPPDENARISILKIHTKNWKIKPTESLLAQIAAATSGFSGAHLENLCKQASDCALQRLKFTKNVENITAQFLKQVVVSKEDWFQAIREMGRPNTNAYRGILYVPQRDLKIQPLISGMVRRIKEKILQLSPFTESLNVLNTFLIYGNGKGVATKFVVPELLSDPEFTIYPIFKMTEQIVGPEYFWQVKTIMAQVMAQPQPCILYIPDCDKLFSQLSDENNNGEGAYLSYLVGKLRLATSRPVLILGSSSCSQYNFPEECRTIFPAVTKPECSYKLRVPTEEERKLFFSTVLDKRAFCGSTKSCAVWDKFFLEKLEESVKITQFDPIDYLVDLHSQLQETAERYKIIDDEITSKNEHVKMVKDALTNVIKNYRIKP